MSEIVEHNLDGHTQLIFPCDCHDDHYLHLSWDDDDSEWRYIYVSNQWRPVGIWAKLKDCIKILRNREYMTDEVVLNDKVIDALKEFLKDK